MSTLWNKGTSATEVVEKFTVGDDNILDLQLAKYDVIGSKAHIKMLKSIDLLTSEEEKILQKELDQILSEIECGYFRIEENVEDIHSQIEFTLCNRVGDIGKKIHSGRSRNDQVLVDLKLFFRDKILEIRESVLELFNTLQRLSEEHKDILIAGYTHGQIAMPSSFGLWLGAHAESLADDMIMLKAAYKFANQNPLGSAAGYGNSFPLDREMTTKLLRFETMHYNSIEAQMSRGKCEKSLAYAMASIASTLNKLATDCCQYMSQNYGFISFPDSLTTGSSIMPHKKNPDVWELVRGKANRLLSVPNELALLCTNMPVGYHRDYQLTKDIIFPAIKTCLDIIRISTYMLENIIVNKDCISDKKYQYLFTVEEVNKLVLEGMPFREAYIKVGKDVNEGKFSQYVDKYQSVNDLHHTHIGSIGNLATKEIARKMKRAWED